MIEYRGCTITLFFGRYIVTWPVLGGVGRKDGFPSIQEARLYIDNTLAPQKETHNA